MTLLTPAKAAKHLGIGKDTLRGLRKDGEIRYVNVGRGKKRESPRYDVADLDAWLEESKRKCPSTSVPIPKTASTATTSGSAVADFLAARERLLGEKPKK